MPYQNGANDWLFEGTHDRAFMASPVSLDKNMNYNVDAIYIGETWDSNNGAGETWEGAMYKITVPYINGTGSYYGDVEGGGSYVDDPDDAVNPWYLHMLFDSPAPITAPAALSIDTANNAWVYFGTGRLLNVEDKLSADQQYFFGIKDPFFNRAHDTSANNPSCTFCDGYYHESSSSLTLDMANLFESDLYIITTDASAYTQSGASYSLQGNFDWLISQAKLEDGWYRTLTYSGERFIVKPAVAGGIVFAATYAPTSDICGLGGNSYLYSFYYETGTPWKKSVFGSDTTTISKGEKIEGVIDLGEGMSSSPALHMGKQDGGTLFIQKSTGEVVGLDVTPALSVKSGLKSWIEK